MPKRFLLVSMLALACLSAGPVRATSTTGHVDLPMPFLFGAARTAYQADGSLDQRIGDVLVFPGAGLPHGTAFTVTKTAGATPVQWEIEFYTSLSGSGSCDPPSSGLTGGWGAGGSKSGVIDCDGASAKYAIVILVYGANADFKISW